ncbi:MAG: PRC-barrel domain-containing protein [Ignavibacteriae bacterium]|nr:PRC-barrel domain-containing protein [Ignavibacteriota bacterium]
MLRSVNSLRGYSILATDGEIGAVDDLFFDDQTWAVAYLVARLGGLLDAKRVLLPPTALGRPDWEKQQFPVAASKRDIENCPDIDLDKPISRQHEEELFKYFGWAPYWMPGGAPMGVLPIIPPPIPETSTATDPDEHADPHLQSARDVVGYRLQATDGRIGHVDDFVVDDATWSFKYIVVDTAILLAGRKVIIAPRWIRSINWEDQTVQIEFSMQMVKDSPHFDPSAPINEAYERRLYDYYGRPILPT